MAENFLKWIKNKKQMLKKRLHNHNRINTKKTTPRHIIAMNRLISEKALDECLENEPPYYCNYYYCYYLYMSIITYNQISLM